MCHYQLPCLACKFQISHKVINIVYVIVIHYASMVVYCQSLNFANELAYGPVFVCSAIKPVLEKHPMVYGNMSRDGMEAVKKRVT